jgi:hypothetical protein
MQLAERGVRIALHYRSDGKPLKRPLPVLPERGTRFTAHSTHPPR